MSAPDWLKGIAILIRPIGHSDPSEEIIPSMVALATRTGCAVYGQVGPVNVFVTPEDDPGAVTANWTHAVQEGVSYASADHPLKGPKQ